MISAPSCENIPIAFEAFPVNVILFLFSAIALWTILPPELSELLATIPIFCSPLVIVIVPLLYAFGVIFAGLLSVLVVPKSTLIPIFLIPVTVIVPLPSLVISSLAFTFKTIPVLPCPPETFIVPLFWTFPWYALIEELSFNVLSSITAIPDESE